MKPHSPVLRHLPLFDGPVSFAGAMSVGARESRTPLGGKSQPRLLVVDDDQATLLALSEALRLRLGNVTIETATSSECAIAKMSCDPYDLVICDIVMPGTDGLAFLKESRRLYPETPVILVTGRPGFEEATQFSGAFAFFEKPLEIRGFVDVVRGALERTELQRRVRERNQSSVLNLIPSIPTSM
jgi:DNA-binding NtrC family response regulator